MSVPWSRATCCSASSMACRTCRSGSFKVLPHQVGVFRMLVQIVDHEAAAGDHLATVGADHLQCPLHELRGNATPAQGARRLGMGDDDGLRRFAVIGKGGLTSGVELE